MRNIRALTLACFTALCGLYLAACQTNSAPSLAYAKDSSEAAPRIIAIGDIHGSYENYSNALKAAGLIGSDGRWSGGKTIFVQTGDIADRGPDTRKIIKHIRTLQKQAKKKGGQVITLVGNHEAMNMTGDLRYVHAGEYAAFATEKSAGVRDKIYAANQDRIEAYYAAKNPALTPGAIKSEWEATTPLGQLEHQAGWNPKGEIGKWIAKNQVVALVDGYLFAHGGVSKEYSSFSIKEMNKAGSKALKAQSTDEASIINDALGPLWYRGFVPGNQRATDPTQTGPAVTAAPLSPNEELELVLNTFDAKRMIVGHTPSLSGIADHYNGKFIQIDTGLSPHYGGTISFLRIEDGIVYAHDNGQERIIP